MANIFLRENESQQHAGNDDTLFGRSGGSETVVLLEGATSNELDGNIERVSVPASASNAQFVVNDQGQLQIQTNGTVLAAFTAGLNQPVDVGFSAGSLKIEQTGATTFEIQNPNDVADTVVVDQNTSQTGNSVGLGTPDLERGNISTSGEVLVDGASRSEIPLVAGNIVVGDTSIGSLSADNGTDFRLSADRTFSDGDIGNLILGRTPNSEGTVTLSGDGTSLETAGANNSVQAGLNGTGTLNINNGARVNTLQLEAGRNGTGDINVSGNGTHVVASPERGTYSFYPVFEAGFISVGNGDGSNGSITVTDGALLEARPGLKNNANTSGPGLELADTSGATGELLVDDAEVRIHQDRHFGLRSFS